MQRELEHVVGAAGFAGGGIEMTRKGSHRKEMFVVAVAADDIGTMQCHPVPEIPGNVGKTGLSGQFIKPCGADGFGDLHVGMQSIKDVVAARQRIHDGPVIKFFRQVEIIGIAGQRIELGHGLVHAALFADQHLSAIALRSGFSWWRPPSPQNSWPPPTPARRRKNGTHQSIRQIPCEWCTTAPRRR